MSKGVIGLGIDHGFGNIKTAHCIMKAGVRHFKKEPEILSRVVGFKDAYYVVGGSRMQVKKSKTQDIDYYILTLAGIAEELKIRGLKNATISLGAGLPLTRVGEEKENFKEYLMCKGEEVVCFTYEGIPYEVIIKEVEIYPQGYAAVLPWLGELPSPCLIMEWGSWTVDIIYMEEGTPILERCHSLPYGFIRCQREINIEMMRAFNEQAEEKNMENIMLGEDVIMPEKYQRLIKEQIRLYIKKVIGSMKEYGFSLDMIPVIHLGGGASVVKRFGEYDLAMTRIIEGIAVNATAYEQLIRKKL